MSAIDGVYRRVVRRETHSSRSGAAITGAILLILLLAATGVFAGWWLFDTDFRSKVDTVISGLLGQGQLEWLIAAGGAAIVVAIVLLGFALTPGRLARHGRRTGRTALIIDDSALADAIADRVAYVVGVDRSRVSVSVGSSTAKVRITPLSGVDVDAGAATAAAEQVAHDIGFPLRVTTTIAEGGQIS